MGGRRPAQYFGTPGYCRWFRYRELHRVSGYSSNRLTAFNPVTLWTRGYAPFTQLGQPTNDPVQFPEDAALRQIAEGIKSETGERLLFVARTSSGAGVELSVRVRLRTIDRSATFPHARGVGSRTVPSSFEFPLAGTPCEAVLKGNTAHYPENLCQLFPEDKGLAVWAAQSYCGVPLVDLSDRVVGHLAIIDDKPMLDRGLRVASCGFSLRGHTPRSSGCGLNGN